MHIQFEYNSHSALFMGYRSNPKAEEARELNTTGDQAREIDHASFTTSFWEQG